MRAFGYLHRCCSFSQVLSRRSRCGRIPLGVVLEELLLAAAGAPPFVAAACAPPFVAAAGAPPFVAAAAAAAFAGTADVASPLVALSALWASRFPDGRVGGRKATGVLLLGLVALELPEAIEASLSRILYSASRRLRFDLSILLTFFSLLLLRTASSGFNAIAFT